MAYTAGRPAGGLAASALINGAEAAGVELPDTRLPQVPLGDPSTWIDCEYETPRHGLGSRVCVLHGQEGCCECRFDLN